MIEQSKVAGLEADGLDARVLELGAGSAGAGLLSLAALRAGARHVSCCERWLYLAQTCKEALLANGATDAEAAVVYKRPTDLALLRDVPVACNLVVCDGLIDGGLLTSGLLPGLRHRVTLLLHHVREDLRRELRDEQAHGDDRDRLDDEDRLGALRHRVGAYRGAGEHRAQVPA